MRLFLSHLLFIATPLYAQTFTISGTVRDGATNEPLPLTNVFVKETKTGTATDSNGAFQFALAAGDYQVLVSFIGYKTETLPVVLREQNLVMNVKLFPTDILLQEVTVYSSPAEQVVAGEISSVSVQSKTIGEISAVLPDVLRSVQSFPGISANNEFSAKFNVRGGNYDENLVLVNGANVYEPFHVKEADNASLGIFNVDLIHKVDLMTGGFSARYGDRLSSVLNIEYREGSREQYKGAATLSLTNLDAFVEGPLTPNGSFILGARKSYLEYVLSVLDVEQSAKPAFYDVQGVLTYSLSPKHKLLFEFIHAGDDFKFDPTFQRDGPFQSRGQFNGQPATFNENSTDFEEEKDRYFSNLFDIQSTSFLSGTAFLKNEISYYDQIEEENRFATDDYRVDIASTQNYFYEFHGEHLEKNNLRIKTLEGKTSIDAQLTPFHELRSGFSYQKIFYDQELLDQRISEERYNTIGYPDTTFVRTVGGGIDAADEKIEAESFKLAVETGTTVRGSARLIAPARKRPSARRGVCITSHRFIDRLLIRPPPTLTRRRSAPRIIFSALNISYRSML